MQVQNKSFISKFPKRVGNYIAHYIIGKGAFSYVFAGVNTKTNQSCALKFVERKQLENKLKLMNFEREQRIFQRLSHQGIAKYIETIYLEDYIVIANIYGVRVYSIPDEDEN